MAHPAPLTKSERFLLNEVDSCPDKVASVSLLKHAARLSPTGFLRVLTKLVDNNLLGHTDDGRVTLTFGGMTAMRSNGMEVQS